LDRCRTSAAEREVVFGAAALIAMTVDPNYGLRPLREPLRVLLQYQPGIVPQRVLVVVEERIAEWTLRIELAE